MLIELVIRCDSITIGQRKKKTVNVGDVFTKRDGRWQRKVLFLYQHNGIPFVIYSQDLVGDKRGFEGECTCHVETLFEWGSKTDSKNRQQKRLAI